MKSAKFNCPHCKRSLTKSAQAQVLSEALGNPRAGFIGLGEMPESLTCPGCHGKLDTQKMLKGGYDPKPASLWEFVITLAVIGVIWWSCSR